MLNTVSLSIAGRILPEQKLLIDKGPFRRHIYESVTLREFLISRSKKTPFCKEIRNWLIRMLS